MNTYTKRTLAGYLASAAISISTSNVNAAQFDMEEIPINLLNNVLDEVTETEGELEDKMAVLAMAANDKRTSVRLRVCERIAAMSKQVTWDKIEPLLVKLTHDKATSVRNESAYSMACALGESEIITRTLVTNEWALSEKVPQRVAIANILSQELNCLGVSAITTQLASDSNSEVRLAVVNLAASRIKENPNHYKQILHGLSTDANRRVRHTARRVIQAIEQL
jgi:hypothetical protein